MAEIIDKDLGYKKIVDAFYAVDGLAAWIGILSGGPKYPAKGKQIRGTAVARVAGIHQAKYGWMSKAIDKQDAKAAAEFARARNLIIQGHDPVMILAQIAQEYQKVMRQELLNSGLYVTGRLSKNVKYRIGLAKNVGKTGQQPKWSKIYLTSK